MPGSGVRAKLARSAASGLVNAIRIWTLALSICCRCSAETAREEMNVVKRSGQQSVWVHVGDSQHCDVRDLRAA